MAGIVASVRVEGIRPILRGMSAENPCWAGPWVRGLTELTNDLAATTREVVPVGTGRMQATIKAKLQARPIPLWGKMQMRVGFGKGTRYGGILHGSKRIVYHYRSGPKTGDPTYGWMYVPLAKLKPKLDQMIPSMIRQIESTWDANHE